MNLHPSEIAFLQDLARAKETWLAGAAEAMSDPTKVAWSQDSAAWSKLASCVHAANAEEELQSVLSELLSGLIHSVLVSLDGGTVLAETTSLTVRDESGHEFKRFLHEFWPEYSRRDEA
jgi:hypothetical protein